VPWLVVKAWTVVALPASSIVKTVPRPAPPWVVVPYSAPSAARTSAARAGTPPGELLARVPPELCRAIGLVGTEAEVRARIDEYREAGVDEIAIVPATAGDPGGRRTLEALAD